MQQDVFERMKEQMGDALARKRQMDESVRYWMDHKEEWRELYPNHWVAVCRQRLVAAESSRKRLIEAVAKSDVALEDAFVDFITEDKQYFI